MRNSRIAGLGAVATTAVAALLLGATPALAQDGPRAGSAYAFAASGLLDIGPLVEVESAGELVRDELVGLGERTDEGEAAGVFLGVLNSEAEEGRAQSSVARVELLDLLRADLVRTWCDGDDAGLEIVNGTLLGEELPRFPVGGETTDLSPLARLSFNDQTRGGDGSLTVTGIELEVLPGRGDGEDEELDAGDRESLPLLGELLGVELPGTLGRESEVLDALEEGLGGGEGALQTITIGSATCADRGDDDGGDGGRDDDADGGGEEEDGDGGGYGAAPAPAVVEADLPVTG